MENKKAFTLVELLGVIVVLAIRALITIPIISNVINDVRIKSLRDSAYGLIEASNLYYAQYGTNSNIRFNITGNKVESSDTGKLLTYKGSVKEGTVILDRKGQVTVCITDGKNSAYKNYNETKVTTVKGKTCEIKANSSIVYLGDDATIDFYDNTKLTELVNSMQEEINALKEKSNNVAKEIYPGGSIYMTMTENTVSKVEEKFGGTWEQIESGLMLQSTSTNSGQTGGSTTATFTPAGTVEPHRLTISEMPTHNHTYRTVWDNESGSGSIYPKGAVSNGNNKGWNDETSIGAGFSGGNQSHNHTFTGNQVTIDTVSPYITVYMYKRTA